MTVKWNHTGGFDLYNTQHHALIFSLCPWKGINEWNLGLEVNTYIGCQNNVVLSLLLFVDRHSFPWCLCLSLSEHLLPLLGSEWVCVAVGRSVWLKKQQLHPFLESLAIFNWRYLFLSHYEVFSRQRLYIDCQRISFPLLCHIFNIEQ